LFNIQNGLVLMRSVVGSNLYMSNTYPNNLILWLLLSCWLSTRSCRFM